MRKRMFKSLVYTQPDSSPSFTSKLNLSNTKNSGLIFILASLLNRGMQRVNWLPPKTIVAHVFLKIKLRGCPIIHSLSNGAMLERLVNATLERFSFECRKVISFALSTRCDWLKRFAPPFHPIRSKTKANCDALACIFPRFASATCNYFEF